MQVDFAALTDRGRARLQNQDSVLALRRSATGELLLAVADGLGGLYDGAGASRRLVEELQLLAEAPGQALTPANVAAAMGRVNDELFQRALRSPALLGGTTAVVALLAGGVLQCLHAGDSRAYLLRRGTLNRLTEDHSVVAEQVRAGLITEEEAAVSPERNIVTICVGTESKLQPSIGSPVALEPGDRVLLSSDGLHGVVPHGELGEILGRDRPAVDLASALVARANALGGPDNISAAIAVITGNPGADRPAGSA